MTDWHGARFRPGQSEGHYESWFVRANHPTRKEAFWIRYTIFSPAGRPQDAIGELWAIHSDGERGRIRAGKAEVPIAQTAFMREGLDVRIGEATFQPGWLLGSVGSPAQLHWDLHYDGGGEPLVFLPPALYEARLPKAKAVTPRPLVVFHGHLDVDGERVPIDGWTGSENHNWGSKHTDTYAWGQVAGFDGAPDAFLEAITARIKLGPVWTPRMTILVLRVGGEEFRLNAPSTALLRAHGRWRWFEWNFDSHERGVRIHGRVHAAREDFVGLTYHNPPGGDHTCLNSKVAACEVTLEREGRPPLVLRTRNRAAFEILTDERDHGVPIVV